MQSLIDNINQIVKLKSDEIDMVCEAFHLQQLKKGELWIKEGKTCNQIAFLESGKLRVYYNNNSGSEVTCYFVKPGTYISSYTSFLTRTPAMENIVAIDESLLFVITKDALEAISIKVLALQIWRRVIAENLFIVLERRISMLQSQSAGERYAKMLEDNPDLILTVPLQYTASFLGITPQHLSRLRKGIQK